MNKNPFKGENKFVIPKIGFGQREGKDIQSFSIPKFQTNALPLALKNLRINPADKMTNMVDLTQALTLKSTAVPRPTTMNKSGTKVNLPSNFILLEPLTKRRKSLQTRNCSALGRILCTKYSILVPKRSKNKGSPSIRSFDFSTTSPDDFLMSLAQ